MRAERGIEARIRLTLGHDFTLDVDLSVPPGITILFGPSGSGKSTTLAAIAGLLRPDHGRVVAGDEIWFDSEGGVDRPVQKRGLAFVFQSPALFPHMTALENVEYGIDRGCDRAERQRRALATLTRMKVPHLADRRPRTFSGGEAQRVALARAFARSPRVALLDEPFSAMDRRLWTELCADVRATILELEIPALVVTHRRNEARMMGDRLIVLAQGRVKSTGGMEDLSLVDDRPDVLALEGAGDRPPL